MRYIESNDEVKQIQYGFFSSSYNGCGWIAVWNYLFSLGKAPSRPTVAQIMERYLCFGGIFGTSLEGLKCAMRYFGYTPKVYTKLTTEVLTADRVILYYGKGLKRHFGFAVRHEKDIFKYKNPTIKAESLKEHEQRIKPTFINYIICERVD